MLIACFLCNREQARAGIVDKDIQSADVRVCLMNCLLHLRRVGDVEGKGPHRVAKASREIGYVCQFAGGRCNPITALKSSLSPDAAEPSSAVQTSVSSPVFTRARRRRHIAEPRYRQKRQAFPSVHARG